VEGEEDKSLDKYKHLWEQLNLLKCENQEQVWNMKETPPKHIKSKKSQNVVITPLVKIPQRNKISNNSSL